MISDLLKDNADIPLPPPNQWDPSHKSALPSSFSRTPGILWLWSGSEINHIIGYVWYVTHSKTDNHMSNSLWRHCEAQAAVTCMAHYVKWLRPLVHTYCFAFQWIYGKVAPENGLHLYSDSPPHHIFVRRDPFDLERLSNVKPLWAELSLDDSIINRYYAHNFFCWDFSCIWVHHWYMMPENKGFYKSCLPCTLQNQ